MWFRKKKPVDDTRGSPPAIASIQWNVCGLPLLLVPPYYDWAEERLVDIQYCHRPAVSPGGLCSTHLSCLGRIGQRTPRASRSPWEDRVRVVDVVAIAVRHGRSQLSYFSSETEYAEALVRSQERLYAQGVLP